MVTAALYWSFGELNESNVETLKIHFYSYLGLIYFNIFIFVLNQHSKQYITVGSVEFH